MKKIIIVLVGILIATSLKAQSKKDFNPVMTAVVSQSIAADARGSSLGDQGVATEADVNSQHWNVAKYPFTISRAGLSINYTPWLRKIVSGIALLDATGYIRLGEYQAVSASLRYFTLGDVVDHDITVRPYEMAIDLGYSRMLSETFSAGVALRYMYSDLSGKYDDSRKPGSAFAADLGIYWNDYVMLGQRESLLSFGLSINDVGSKINYGSDFSYFIPTRMRLGGSLLLPVNEYNRLSFSAEASKLLVPSKPLQLDDESNEDYQERILETYYDMSSIKGIFKSFGDSERGFKGELQEIEWSLGAEYVYNDKFTLRGGYHYQHESQGGLSYYTVGAGFRMNVMAIDAGYVIATNATNPLDQTLRVGLTFDMDGIKEMFGRR